MMVDNVRKRILSGITIGILFITSIFFSLPPFTVLMMVIGMVMVFEWYQMSQEQRLFLFLGPIIMFPAIISLVLVHNYQNRWLVLGYFAMIWAVDTFAMIGGRILRGPKLAPVLSPDKTWSGLICGVSSGTLVFLAIYYLFAKQYLDQDLVFAKHIVLFAPLMCVTAQVSDLFISYFKRKFHIKDSGSVIPGHGGMLDRFDSIILTAPILFFAVYAP
jgi:phosphatidate cytidylyltransferase